MVNMMLDLRRARPNPQDIFGPWRPGLTPRVPPMVKKLAREALAENLTRMIRENSNGKPNVHAWATSKKLDVKRIQRLTGEDTAVKLSTLQEVADGLGIEVWELLYPDLDMRQRPKVQNWSPAAVDVARMLDALDEGKRRIAYAMIIQMIEFGNPPTEPPEPPSPPATHKPSPSLQKHRG